MNPMKLPLFILSCFLVLTSLGQGTTIGTAPTLASLTNRPPSTINPVVITQGRVTPGDGKGGMFTWVPSSTATIDWTNVLGSSLTSTGRWLLSLPSPTPEVSDSSKVDRTNGTGTGLDLTDTDLLGTTRVNGVNLETSLSGKVSGSGTAGQFPAFNGTSSVGPSGVSTNAARNVNRVVLTSAELVATSPTDLAATTGGTLSFVTTTGDVTAGDGVRHWRWNSASTASTNAATAGGPIAYPYGGATGRWEQVSPSASASTVYRQMIIPGLYPDASDGTMNATDPATNVQAYWDAASAAYDAVLGPVTLDHPSNTFTGGELQIKKNVIYRSDGVFHWKKRYNPSGTSQRSVVTTVRMGGATLDTDGSFLSWNAAGGTNSYYSVADRWYGLSDNIKFVGTGKFIWDQNYKNLSQPCCSLLEVRDLYIGQGVMESWLLASTNSSAQNNYGFQLCGRNVTWMFPIIRYGSVTTQDGMHIGWGNNITILGGFSQSGDDSLALQAEAGGGSTLPPDEPLENVKIIGWDADPLRARACVIHAGVNWISAPYVYRTCELRNIIVSGISGYVSKVRQSALQIGNFQEASGIASYDIQDGGAGYTDGYYWLPVTASGGGTGAAAVVKVSGGTITRAYPAKGGTGTGYLVNHSGTYSIGETNITVDTGTGTILAGDQVQFAGNSTKYYVWSTLSGGSINLSSGLVATLADNTAMTITSSSAAWKHGSGYTAGETVITSGLIPGGSGAIINATVFGSPNYRIQNCWIENFALVSGGPTHDGTEAYGMRLHGATDSGFRNGGIVLIESTSVPGHRPYFIEAAQDCLIENVTVQCITNSSTGWQYTSTANGGAINTTKYGSVVDGLQFVNVKIGPFRNTGNGSVKTTGTQIGRISFSRCKFQVGTGCSAFYIPDYESSKTCYVTNLSVKDCVFLAESGATSTQALNIVQNAGGTGLAIGDLTFVGNTLTGITTFDSASVVQSGITSYLIDRNKGGYRTKLGHVVTQTSGTSQVTVTVSTYTGLIDNTTASLPCVRVVPLGNPGSNWWIEPSTTGAFLIKTASAVGSDLNWAVYEDTSTKPLTGY